MDYSEINNLLSNLDIEENSKKEDLSPPPQEKIQSQQNNMNRYFDINTHNHKKKNEDIISNDKKKINNFLCFRDIDLRKNIKLDKTVSDDIKKDNSSIKPNEINNVLNERIFDIKNDYKAHIMDFYPKITRNNNT